MTEPPAGGGPLPSDNSSLRFNGFRIGATFDTRTSPGFSTSGTLLRATTARYAQAGSLPYNFQQSQLKAIQLVPSGPRAVRAHIVEYHIAHLVFANPTIGAEAKVTPSGEAQRKMQPADVQWLLSKAKRDSDGSYRVIASKAAPGRPVGRVHQSRCLCHRCAG